MDAHLDLVRFVGCVSRWGQGCEHSVTYWVYVVGSAAVANGRQHDVPVSGQLNTSPDTVCSFVVLEGR